MKGVAAATPLLHESRYDARGGAFAPSRIEAGLWGIGGPFFDGGGGHRRKPGGANYGRLPLPLPSLPSGLPSGFRPNMREMAILAYGLPVLDR